MLRYRSTRQPLRPYPVPAGTRPSSAQPTCSICSACLWNTDLFGRLEELPPTRNIFETEYNVTTAELRRSVLEEGCRWCRTIADGLHSKVFNDRSDEQRIRSAKLSGSRKKDHEDENGDRVRVQTDRMSHTTRPDRGDTTIGEASNSLESYRSKYGTHSPPGAFGEMITSSQEPNYSELHDILSCQCTFVITLNFLLHSAIVARIAAMYRCIFQDFDEDKARELPRMKDIYQSAAVTIVAAVASSVQEGFLHVISTLEYFLEPINIPYQPRQKSAQARTRRQKLIVSHPAYYDWKRDPIHDRAWTFQELLVSPRIIMFSYDGVHIIDNGRCVSSPSPLPVWGTQQCALHHLLEEFPPRSTAAEAFAFSVIWYRARAEYSRRHLSCASDKLIAISAIAMELQNLRKGVYLAGLWEEDLISDLQWRITRAAGAKPVESPRRHPASAGYVAPSWSWASADGEIEAACSATDWATWKQDFEADIISCTVEPVVPGFEFGAVKSGTLVVKARMSSFIWRPDAGPGLITRMGWDGFLVVADQEGLGEEKRVGEALIDAADPELVNGVVVDCIAMSLMKNPRQRPQVEGLMLMKVVRTEATWRRVGFFCGHDLHMFDDVEKVEVTVI